MAYTYPRLGLKVKAEDSYLSQLIRQDLETDSSTFVDGSPVIYTSGLITIAAAAALAAGSLVGFARRAGQNGTGATAEYIMALPGMTFFANFLNDANPHNTTKAIAAADNGVGVELQIDANITEDGGKARVHVSDDTTTATVMMFSFQSDHVRPNSNLNAGRCVVADLNARPLFVVMNSALAYA